MTEEPKEKKLNWWVDLALFMFAPVSSLVVASLGGSGDLMASVVLLLPIPLALIIGGRVALRGDNSMTVLVILGIVFAFGIYAATCVLSICGCSLGGGFNI